MEPGESPPDGIGIVTIFSYICSGRKNTIPMTLNEHLELIARSMSDKGATETGILLFQLYLICSAKAGRPGSGSQAGEAPFGRIDGVLAPVRAKVDSGLAESFLKDDDIRQLRDEELKNAFDGLLNRTARSRGFSFDHLQPRELSVIVSELCGETEGKSIYNPYAGVGSYAGVFHAGDRYHGEEYDPQTWAIGSLKMWMEGCPSANYVCGDSLSPGWDGPFDIVVSTPPIGRVPNRMETFTERMASDAPSLLAPGGTLVMVTTMSALTENRAKDLLDTGMLDLVVALPGAVLYWTNYAPVIVRLRKDRREDEPVTLVDGSSFFFPGGRGTRIIDDRSLLEAIAGKSPLTTVTLSREEILRLPYGLNPKMHLVGRDGCPEGGIQTFFLQDLCERLSLPRYKEATGLDGVPEKAITVSDLTSEPCEADLEPHLLEKGTGSFGILDRSALLVYGTSGKVRVGYAHASPDAPVYVQSGIYAFAPDEDKVSIRYLVHVLPTAEINNYASSSIKVSLQEILLARIPLLSKAGQEERIKKDIESYESGGKEKSKKRWKKPQVVIIGDLDPSSVLRARLEVKMIFQDPSDAGDWISGNKRNVDAVIICYSGEMNSFEVYRLCRNEQIDRPIYFLTFEGRSLEDVFRNHSEQILNGRCFSPGSEGELADTLVGEVNERNTPEWRLRRRYARELSAADSIDKKFPERKFSLRGTLEDILFSEDARPDWRNTLRTIRDECFLKILVDYGFLPGVDGRTLTMGGLLDLLADRHVLPKGKDFWIVLIREVVPAALAEMMRGSRRLLNEGSHTFRGTEWDLQMAALFIVMAALCHLSDMIDKGDLDRRDVDGNRRRHITKIPTRVDPGDGTVRNLVDDPDYLYAGNVHLDSNTCRTNGVQTGDRVIIHDAGREGCPRISDTFTIMFYSASFTKMAG